MAEGLWHHPTQHTAHSTQKQNTINYKILLGMNFFETFITNE